MVIDKATKYDRQLRLWGPDGQEALENASIALFGATATGCETLKNLVLPGIGQFTIIDDKQVKYEDCGVNFFVRLTDVSRPRAEVAVELLNELNTDVIGHVWHESPEEAVYSSMSRITETFDLVIVAEMPLPALHRLADRLYAEDIPLIVAQTNGFIGRIQISIPEHTVIETHPDTSSDLRLDKPWPDLLELAANLDLSSLDDEAHTHVPFVLLLLHYKRLWLTEHGNLPTTYEQKNAFKDLIRAEIRNNDEENFDEAIANVWRACGKSTISSDVQRILDDDKCRHLTAKSTMFWFLARGVADFVNLSEEGDGLLPLSGALPDMKSTTEAYVQLQHIYRAKAKVDAGKVLIHVQDHLASVGLSRDRYSQEEVEHFCKHSANLKLLRYSSLKDQTHFDKLPLEDGASDPSAFVLAYHAAELQASPEDYPGQRNEADLASCTQALLTTTGTLLGRNPPSAVHKACAELVRSGGGELHNIASLVGGVASQEAIKLLTKQYVPLNNTWIFDGVHSTSQVFQL
ncbi:NEDD8-activating enzyme E1 regulatory subunit [Savitreella phatthalungensis]